MVPTPLFLVSYLPPGCAPTPPPGTVRRWPGDDREWVWDGNEWVGRRTRFDGGDSWETDEG